MTKSDTRTEGDVTKAFVEHSSGASGSVVRPVGLVDEKTAAAFLCMSVEWLQQDRITKRRIPYIKISRSVRYDVADLVAFKDRCKVGG
jgi:hypothetical protein